jgi:hypothetical protein
MNYPAAELRSIKMNFYLFNPDAEHRGILLIKIDRIHSIPKFLNQTRVQFSCNPVTAKRVTAIFPS